MRVIASVLPVASSATLSSWPRLWANSSSSARVVFTRPAERALPPSEIATSQKSLWTSNPMKRTLPPLVVLRGRQTGERQLPIRARSPAGPVARAATYLDGLAAHKTQDGLPCLRSPMSPQHPTPATLGAPPDGPAESAARIFHAGIWDRQRTVKDKFRSPRQMVNR